MKEGVPGSDPAGIRLVSPDRLGPAVGFSHAAVAGDLAWIAGQTAMDAAGRVVAPGDIVAQFELAVRNLASAIEAAGCRPEDVLKVTYYVTDVDAYRDNLEPIGRAYRAVFGRHFPAATLLGVARLFDPEAMVEIDCVARIPRAAG